MPTLGLRGPWDLDDATIDRIITRTSPGNYALGHVKTDGPFVVLYVGRSDDDLNSRLHDWTGQTRYKSFKADYASSVREAYKKECSNYHDFGGCEKLDNKYHPDSPNNLSITCHICGA